MLTAHNFLMGFVLFSPVAILYFQRVAGSFALGMSIFSAAVFSTAVFEVPTGVISDRVGRRLTIILGSVCYLLAYIFYAVGISYLYLLAGAILAGIGRAFYSGNNHALLYDTLKENGLEDKYEHYLGKTMSAEHLSLAISAGLGGVLASVSFKLVMWLSVAPQLFNLFVSFLFYEPQTTTNKIETNVYAHFKRSLVKFISSKKIRVLTAASSLSYAFSEASFQFRAAFVKQLWPVWALGIPSILSHIGASVGYYWSGSIIRKAGAKLVVVGGNLFSRVISLVSFCFPTVISPLLLAAPSFLYGVKQTAKNNLFQREFSDEQRATMSSINSLLGSILFGIGSLAIGFLADAVGPTNTLIIAQLITLFPLGLYFYFFKLASD